MANFMLVPLFQNAAIPKISLNRSALNAPNASLAKSTPKKQKEAKFFMLVQSIQIANLPYGTSRLIDAVQTALLYWFRPIKTK